MGQLTLKIPLERLHVDNQYTIYQWVKHVSLCFPALGENSLFLQLNTKHSNLAFRGHIVQKINTSLNVYIQYREKLQIWQTYRNWYQMKEQHIQAQIDEGFTLWERCGAWDWHLGSGTNRGKHLYVQFNSNMLNTNMMGTKKEVNSIHLLLASQLWIHFLGPSPNE